MERGASREEQSEKKLNMTSIGQIQRQSHDFFLD